MKTGVVKFFKEDKGFGFILDNDTQEDVFVHVSGCNGKIFAGDNVEFEILSLIHI